LEDDDIYDPVKASMSQDLNQMPWPQTDTTSYFVLNAPDIRCLCVSKARGVWGVPVNVASQINACLQKSQHVLLLFMVKPLGGIYGMAEVRGAVPPAPPGCPMSPEFPVSWIRATRISLKMVSHLKHKDGVSLARSYGDEEVERAVGYEIWLVLLRKQPWDWAKEPTRAESGKITHPAGQTTDDTLFTYAWAIERAQEVTHGGGRPLMGTNNRGTNATPADEFFYNGDQAGYVVGGHPRIMDEIFHKRLFGLPLQQKEQAQTAIDKNTPVFLLDTQNNMLFGLFEAKAQPVLNFDRQAFKDRRDRQAETTLPLQFLFDVILEAPPVHHDAPEIALTFGGRAVGVGPISLNETKQLSTIFAARSGVIRPPKWLEEGTAPNFGSGEASPLQPREYISSYKPPFKNFANVVVGIPLHNPDVIFRVRRALLGPQAAFVLKVCITPPFFSPSPPHHR
jgi:hypothetical protein